MTLGMCHILTMGIHPRHLWNLKIAVKDIKLWELQILPEGMMIRNVWCQLKFWWTCPTSFNCFSHNPRPFKWSENSYTQADCKAGLIKVTGSAVKTCALPTSLQECTLHWASAWDTHRRLLLADYEQTYESTESCVPFRYLWLKQVLKVWLSYNLASKLGPF